MLVSGVKQKTFVWFICQDYRLGNTVPLTQSDLNTRGSSWERMHVRKGNPQADLLFNAQCSVLCLSQASGKGVLVLNRADTLLRITFWPAYKINLVRNRTSELQKYNSNIKNDLKIPPIFIFYFYFKKCLEYISKQRSRTTFPQKCKSSSGNKL